MNNSKLSDEATEFADRLQHYGLVILRRNVAFRAPVVCSRGRLAQHGMAGVVRGSGPKRFGAVPSAVSTIARLVCARARAAGIDVAPLLAQAGLTARQIDDRSARIEAQRQIRLFELIADALQDDLLGFHFAESFDLRELGLLYYVAASSDSLGEALRRLQRYSTIINDAVVLRIHEGEDLSVMLHYVGIERLSDRQQIEGWVTALVRLARQLTNRRLVPNWVSFCHRRAGGCPELKAFLGCDVLYGAAADEIAFPGVVEQMSVVNADPYLNELLIKYCEETVTHQQASRAPLRLEVENLIAVLLPHGKAHVGEIARRLGMSPRTLSRRLALEGSTFAAIVAELRADLAKRYLNEEGLAISQIAWLLGFQEVSAFTHAFKRWTGKTPREIRAQKNSAAHMPGDGSLKGGQRPQGGAA